MDFKELERLCDPGRKDYEAIARVNHLSDILAAQNKASGACANYILAKYVPQYLQPPLGVFAQRVSDAFHKMEALRQSYEHIYGVSIEKDLELDEMVREISDQA